MEIDSYYNDVVSFVVSNQQASVSAIQRKFRIGYNRAARIIEQLQSEGVVSEYKSNGTLKVLANKEAYPES